MKKHVMMIMLLGVSVALAGCSGSTKETETQTSAVKETAAVRETEAAETEAAEDTAAEAAESEAAEAAETEAAEAAETEAAEAAETEAAEAAETEAAEAAETEAAEAAETEAAEAAETEAAEAEETEAAEAETMPETEEEDVIMVVETESDDLSETEEYDYYETEYYDMDMTEAETEAETEPRPEYEISDYLTIDDTDYLDMEIEVTKAAEVTDEEVMEYIEDDIADADLYEEITEGTVEEGDLVNIDYEGKKDGVAFDGGTAEGYDLEIGSGTFIDGFEDGLIGVEVGDTVDLELTFPEDYGNEELNGADVVFTVTVNSIKEIPEFTDEIAEELSDGEYTTAEEYEEAVRAELEEDNADTQLNEKYSAVLSKLYEMYPIEDYPQDVIDYYVDPVIEDMESQAEEYGMETDDFLKTYYGVDEEYMKDYYTSYYKSLLAQEMLLTTIGEKEGVTYTDEEFDEALEEYASMYGMTVDEFKSYIDADSAYTEMYERKVMDDLLSKITVTEVEETEADLSETEVYEENATEAEESNDVQTEADAETEADAMIETEVDLDQTEA